MTQRFLPFLTAALVGNLPVSGQPAESHKAVTPVSSPQELLNAVNAAIAPRDGHALTSLRENRDDAAPGG